MDKKKLKKDLGKKLREAFEKPIKLNVGFKEITDEQINEVLSQIDLKKGRAINSSSENERLQQLLILTIEETWNLCQRLNEPSEVHER